jgi:hypothetical protein
MPFRGSGETGDVVITLAPACSANALAESSLRRQAWLEYGGIRPSAAADADRAKAQASFAFPERREIRLARAGDAPGGQARRADARARLPRRTRPDRLSPTYCSDISELIKRASTVNCGRGSIDDRSIPASASCSPSSERRSLLVRARPRRRMASTIREIASRFHEPSNSRAWPVFRCVLESVCVIGVLPSGLAGSMVQRRHCPTRPLSRCVDARERNARGRQIGVKCA